MNEYKVCDTPIREVQDQLILILIELDRICRKHGIRYSIEGGTLLGAEKYGGFVPWDDDLDVVMPRDDYEKFCEVCKTELDGKYFLQNSDTEELFPLRYSKLRMNGTTYVQRNYDRLDIHQGLFVDIVPYDYADKKTYRRKMNLCNLYNGAKTYKLGLKIEFSRQKNPAPWYKVFLYRLFSCLPLKTLNKKILKHSKGRTGSEYMFNFCNPTRESRLMPAALFDEFCELEFEGHSFKAIKDYRGWLTESFGENYMNEEPDELTRGPSHAITYCDIPREERERIGILTFHRADNYGAVLQAYALARFLNERGGDRFSAEIIDYKNDAIEERHRIKPLREYKKITTKAKYFLLNKRRKIDHENYRLFRKYYLPISEVEYDKTNASDMGGEYSRIVVGSDQVWNGLLTGDDRTYFLESVECEKKVSYAASVGAEELWFSSLDKYGELIGKFDAISVRESSLCEGLRERGYDVCRVCDPTFLFTANDYKRIQAKRNLVSGKYILVYMIAFEKDMFDFAKRLSRDTGLPLVYISAGQLGRRGGKNLYSVAPQDFLKLIVDAEFVVTSSLHGLALSAIYNTEAYYQLSKSDNNFNSRVLTLVETLGIKNREIAPGGEIDTTPTDWDEVNARIEEIREKSIKFIDEAIFGNLARNG